MSATQISPRSAPPALRLAPGVIIVAVQWLLWLVVPLVAPEAAAIGMIGGAVGGLGVIVWWLGFSRAPWLDRLGALALMILGVLVTKRLVHPSIANGMMGLMLTFYALPVLSLALVVAVCASRARSAGLRRAVIAGAIVVGCGGFTLLRTGGISGLGASDLHWRWTRTPEEKLLAEASSTTLLGAKNASEIPAAKNPVPTRPPIWPGFRGPARDGVVRGTRIGTDWAASPPIELWRRPVGPGWSSFAVDGDRVFTQEQRGEEEIVSCYDLRSGSPVWSHADPARFWESNAGAGPRGTPTLASGRVYASGATGILNALDARSGAVVWSRNAATDTARKIPEWGFACSPLVVDDTVVIAAEGRAVR